MHEEHPIDERFKALYDAEMDPPGEVRDALARHIGWGPTGAAGGQWRSWLLIGAGAALALTSALHLGHAESRSDTRLVAGHHAPAQETAPSTSTRVLAPTSGTDVAPAKHSSTEPTPSAAHSKSNTATSTTPGTEGHTPGNETTTPHPVQHLPKPYINPATAAQHTAPATGTASTILDTPPLRPEGHGSPATVATEAWPVKSSSATEDAIRMQNIPAGDRIVPGGSPHQAVRPMPYVLPAAQWWWGAYAGAGKLSGEWRGPDSEAMNAAERWRGSTQWGLLFGRRWQGGWSISAGAGLGLTHSTFTHDEQQWERFMDVDTSWTQTFYNNTADVVYTWNIDSVAVERPGTVRSTHARNTYGALQIPLTAAWHGTVRRWHYGAMGGVALWVPTQREGSTLHRQAPDAHLRVVGLGDAATDTRFGPRLYAHAGLSLGFALTETFSVYAEPMMTMPVSTFGRTDAPRMAGHFIQIRLQHEFGSR